MIDIVCVDESINDNVILLIESEVNLNDPKDKEWLCGLISKALSECGENSAEIIFTD